MKNNIPRIVWLSFAVFLISQTNLIWMVISLKPSLLALQLAFTPDRFWQILQAWGPQGVELFRWHFVFDMVHPLIYGSFGFIAASKSPWFLNQGLSGQRLFKWMLPTAALLDYCENLSHLQLLSMAVGSGAGLVLFASVCSAIKWLLAGWFTVVLLRSWFSSLTR